MHSVSIYSEPDGVSSGLDSELSVCFFFLIINLIADIKKTNPDVTEQEDVYKPLRAIELLAHMIYDSQGRGSKKKDQDRCSDGNVPELGCQRKVYAV